MAEASKASKPADTIHDRVVMASRHGDGTPAQSEDFEFIGPKDGVIAAAKHQHVSVALAALQNSTDPDVNPTLEEQEAVIAPAEKKAEAEVNAKHKGAFDA